MRTRAMLIAVLAFLYFGKCAAQAGGDSMQHPASMAEPDTRELLKISPAALEGLRADMRNMLVCLGNVLDLLAAGKRIEAAHALEDGIGMSAMSTHPGMMKASSELPESARMLGMNMHQAASALARDLPKATSEQSLAGLQSIVAGCTSCHLTYRAR